MLLMLDAARFAAYPQLLLLADSRIAILHTLRSAASVSIHSPPLHRTSPSRVLCAVCCVLCAQFISTPHKEQPAPQSPSLTSLVRTALNAHVPLPGVAPMHDAHGTTPRCLAKIVLPRIVRRA